MTGIILIILAAFALPIVWGILKDKFFEKLEAYEAKKEFDLKHFGVRLSDEERRRRVKEAVRASEEAERERQDTLEKLREMQEVTDQARQAAENLLQQRRSNRSPYEVLGISEQATPEEIREAYKKKALENHPDRTAGLGEEYKQLAEKRMKEINAAYEELRRDNGQS